MVSNVETLMTKEETANMLRVALRTIQNLVRDGKLKPVKIGSRVLFDPVDVRKFIEVAKGEA